MTLQEFFAENPRAAIAFSGGVDSSYLLYAARAVRCRRARLLRQDSASSRSLSWTMRSGCAESVGAKLTVLELDALSSEDVRAQSGEPLLLLQAKYFRKSEARGSRGRVLPHARRHERLGRRRATAPVCAPCARWTVRSPLRECGLTKAEIRRLSREAGLFTWDKPAYACLATRVPTGTAHHAGAAGRTRSAPRAGCSRRATRTSASACWTAARAPAAARQISFPGRWRQHDEIVAALKPDYPGSSARSGGAPMHNSSHRPCCTQVRDGSTLRRGRGPAAARGPVRGPRLCASVDHHRRRAAGRGRGHLRRGQNAGADRWHRRCPAAQRARRPCSSRA